MVGNLALNQGIGVRLPAPQPVRRRKSLGGSACHASETVGSNNPDEIEIKKKKRKNFTCPSVASAKEERTFYNSNGRTGCIPILLRFVAQQGEKAD